MSFRSKRPSAPVKNARLADPNLSKKQREDLERSEQLLREVASAKSGVREFTSSSMSTVEKMMASETIGLVGFEELKRMRGEMGAKLRQADETKLGTDAEDNSLTDDSAARKIKKKRKSAQKSKLSFYDDEEEGESEVVSRPKKSRTADPSIDSSFIKTKKEEELERAQREQLKREYLSLQEKIKEETVEFRFCYFDGTYTPGQVTIKKGDQVWLMLDRTRKGNTEFHRGTVDDIMLIQDNIIIPHYYEFHYFILNRVETKSGLLFDFDAVDRDIKRTKVVHRAWYEKNKHIFPANTWQEFDPEIDYTKQVLRDSEGFVYFHQ
ncbi:XAP5, circadian clock regulator-domain-containing protein [Kockiozyma suomiensis]|uniref:XAP5, circadian clock regulator-domain-containing protein n=1 Tax=Kockiozyma suomiensis TaxID=1337062 RepID=UPI0033441D69